MKNILVLFLFLIILTAVRNQELNGSGHDADSNPDGFSTAVFYPVIVAALIIGVVIGSVTTILIMVIATKRCSMNHSVQFSNTKEADFNESKRYRPTGSNVSRSPSSNELMTGTTTATSSTNISRTTKPPLPPIKNKLPSSKISSATADKSKNKETTMEKISSNNPPPVVNKPFQPPVHHMPQHSMPLEKTVAALHTTTIHKSPPPASETELDVSHESSRHDEEHYYSCDVTANNNKKQVSSPTTTGNEGSQGGMSYHDIRDQTGSSEKDTTNSNNTGGGGNKTMASSKKLTTTDETPQYCNVGIKLKDEKREGVHLITGTSSTLPSKRVGGDSTSAHEYMNIKSKSKLRNNTLAHDLYC